MRKRVNRLDPRVWPTEMKILWISSGFIRKKMGLAIFVYKNLMIWFRFLISSFFISFEV